MQFTGERFVPSTKGQLRVEHLQRYALVRGVVAGKRVLDVASGEGYGAALLSGWGSAVVGVDASAEAVRHARETYRGANLHYLVGKCEALPLANGSVDVVVSFETIEHLSDHDAMVRECRRVLAPGGLLIISSPDRNAYRKHTTPNPYHERELSLAEFASLLRANFTAVRIWGQRVAIGCFTYPLDAESAPEKTFAALEVSDELRDSVGVLSSPEYCIAVCGDRDLTELHLESVALDPADDLYAGLTASLQAYDEAVRAASEELATVHATYAAEIARNQAETADVRDVLHAQLLASRAEQEQLTDRLNHLGTSADVREQLTSQLEESRAELAIIHASRSWQLTRPLRDLRRASARVKHRAAARIEPFLRSLYRRLPLASQHRWRLKTAVFRSTGWLMRGTASYQHWAGTEQRARAGSAEAQPGALSREPVPDRVSLPFSATPAVSVVIPVFGEIDRTRRCLASLARHAPGASIEVIVVDDASPERAALGLAGFDGIRIVRNERNEGFIRSSNRGALAANGRFLLFLNNDTEVLAGWCDELLATFDAVPRAGIVGAKLLFPDGRLQEAGGIIWRDGSGWNYGKFDDPAKAEYCYRREVDYVSGAALMIPADLFWEVGGFDEYFAPAYYEDCDLAFKVRDAGRSVIFQPLSRIVHDEGATSGRDLAAGVKRYQLENAEKFKARWRERLAGQYEPGTSVFAARERNVGRRVLVLDHCTPQPDKDAGSIVVLATMRVLQSLGCKVTFVPEDNYLFLERYTTDLERMGVECLSAPFVTSVAQYLAEHGDEFDGVLIFRFTAAARHLAALRRFAPRAPIILDTVDLHFLRESREGSIRGEPHLSERAERTKRDELAVIRQVDCTIVHNTVEQELLARECPGARVVVFGWTIDVPGTSVPFGSRQDLAFVGGYQHPPNVDAAHYFTSEVLPLVRRQLPDVRLHLVGSNPTASLRALQSESVTVTGFVPDLGALLDRVRVTVAPLRYGAGIKGKIATSLSHGVPCVTTPLGAEGMGLEHEREVLIAESAEGMAAEIVRLYENQGLWDALSRNGLAFVRQKYSFDGAVQVFKGILEDLGIAPGTEATSHQVDGLEAVSLSSAAQDSAYRATALARFAERAAIERALIPSGEGPFDVSGFCAVCRRPRIFKTTFDFAAIDEHGVRVPNWREHLMCECGFNARTRAVLHWLTLKLRVPREAMIYLMEQQSPLYGWLKERFPHLVGSEYLGRTVALGKAWRGVRNEDATQLTFPDESFDYLLSFDVFEHVPDYRRAFKEAHRCLRKGGTLLFTAPFVRTNASTLHRARLRESGEIEHLLSPEYHGDPMNAEGGILCFQHFGWDMIDALQAAGFTEAHGVFLWSRRLAYLGGEQALFTATK